MNHQQQQTWDNDPPKGGTQMNRDLPSTYRHILARWRTSGRACMFRVVAIALVACASILGASATTSSHQARAARATTNVAAAYAIKSVSVSVSPTSFAGLCSPTMTFTFTGTITLFAGYGGDPIGYTWLVDGAAPPSPPNPPPSGTVQGNPGDTTIPVGPYPYQMPAGSGTGALHSLQLLAGGTYSTAVDFSLTCSFAVTSVSISTSGSCFNWFVGMTYTGTITIAPSPGGPLTYSWQRVTDGNVNSVNTTGSPATITPGQTALTVTLGPFITNPFPHHSVGTILVVTTPNMVYASPVIRPC